jgi:amidohydrolase
MTGCIGSKVGPIMASADPFSISIEGKGGHAARPQDCVDPIVMGSFIVGAIQTILSRNINPYHPAVISIGKLMSGEVDNIIPSTAMIEGTIRTFYEEDREMIIGKIASISNNVAEAMGGKATFNSILVNRPVINDENMVNIAKRSINEILGPDGYKEVLDPPLTADDFGYFSREVPAVYLFLGCRNENEEVISLHSEFFNFDERSLLVGVRAVSKILLNWGWSDPLFKSSNDNLSGIDIN